MLFFYLICDENVPLNAPDLVEEVPLDAPHVDENARLNAPNPDENVPLNAPDLEENVPLNAPDRKRKDQEKERATKRIRLSTTLPVGKRKSEESRFERNFYENLRNVPWWTADQRRRVNAAGQSDGSAPGGIEPVPVPPPINQAGDGLEEDEAIGDVGELDEDDDEQDEQEINEEE
ncbi:hypothetical protein CDAR_554371 [Caerostris darwini]|uniref:Uncharacterized protein n=1 Tax=Caerostris darwini TaxID=1538125 RepID=A0AAV4SQ25_9ARAC|nr:hypothetical protein CDAR_554371 [Caerostris darwini]